jgi:hypothetical protein
VTLHTEMTMPKKKTKSEKELNLKFTGKMSILIELEGHGPLEFRVNDLQVVKDAVQVILDHTNNKTPVNSYDKREQKTMQKLLDGIE